ncbi:MAG TPA: ATP synthase F0 subunit A [Bacteroidetes bacterium]|nr:ATP synthase F0 subunit A [Bacteroidota bacterium]
MVFSFFVFFPVAVNAQHNENESRAVDSALLHGKEEGFLAGEMITEHVTDSYQWHIISIGEKHVSVYLPVILYDRGEWHVFMSSKLYHGHGSYLGYFIGEEQANLGKIVRKGANGEEIKPALDVSITKNVLALLFSSLLLIIIFLSVARSYKKNKGHAPKGVQSFLEPLIIFVRDDIAKVSIGEKRYKKYTPFLLSVFFFILLNNLLGLIPFFPGGANLTGNLAITGVLALFTFIITTVSGNKNYWVHIINAPGVPWWLKLPIPLMPIVEIMGMFTKPFVLMVRLFANMLAGHIVILGFISLIFIFGAMNQLLGYGVSVVSVGFTIFLDFLELLVAFIQAYVFTLLSALYFGMATEEAHT